MERPSSEQVGCRHLIILQLIGLGDTKKGARVRAPFSFVLGGF
jgi:hypothetical protein